jgi:hypothetical protein
MHDPRTNAETKNILKLIAEAGYDVSDEGEKRAGMKAYSFAVSVWSAYKNKLHATLLQSKPKMSRNESCPCGSGKKYKKCCLKKEGEDSYFSSEENKIVFSHRILPNLLSAEANADGIANLVKIIETYKVFQSARFSVDKMMKFLDKRSSKKLDTEPEIHELAFQYIDESGEYHALDFFEKKFLKAAEDAKNEEELKTLAFGFGLATVYEENKNIHENRYNPLYIVLFHKTVKECITLDSFTDEIIDSIEIENSFEKTEDSGSATAVIQKFSESQTEWLEEQLAQPTEGSEDEPIQDINILLAICDEKFPVKLPFAIAIPYMMTFLEKIDDVNTEYEKKTILAIEHAKTQLIPEDERLYLSVLEAWIEKNSETQKKVWKVKNKWMNWVQKLRELVKNDLFYQYVDALFEISFLTSDYSTIHPEEEKPDYKKLLYPENMQKYADFLEKLGYPEIAKRTRKYATFIENNYD